MSEDLAQLFDLFNFLSGDEQTRAADELLAYASNMNLREEWRKRNIDARYE